METPIAEYTLAQCEAMMDAMIPVVRQHVVAIAAWYGDKLHHHATGALVRFADHFLLVTAAHAIEQFDEGRKHYPDIQLVIDNGDGNQLVPLYGRYFATQKARDPNRPRLIVNDERDDLWDIGLWELDRLTVDLLTAKRFLNRSDISSSEDHADGLYFLAGCPCSWASTDARTRSATWKWLKYAARPSLNCHQLAVFDERFHIALDLSDESDMPLKLEGISGCPIWKLSNWPVPDDWSPEHARVVAVQTCVFTKRPPKAIRGTKWEIVLLVLSNMEAEIREAFRLWLPGKE